MTPEERAAICREAALAHKRKSSREWRQARAERDRLENIARAERLAFEQAVAKAYIDGFKAGTRAERELQTGSIGAYLEAALMGELAETEGNEIDTTPDNQRLRETRRP